MEQQQPAHPKSGGGFTYLKKQCLDYQSFYESGIDGFTFEDISFFTFLEGFANSGNCQRMLCGNKAYYWFSLSLIKDAYPWIDWGDSTWIRRINRIIGLGLLERHVSNGKRQDSKAYYCFGKAHNGVLEVRKKAKKDPMSNMTYPPNQNCDTPYVKPEVPPMSDLTQGQQENTTEVNKDSNTVDSQAVMIVDEEVNPMSNLKYPPNQNCNTPYVKSEVPPMSELTHNTCTIDTSIKDTIVNNHDTRVEDSREKLPSNSSNSSKGDLSRKKSSDKKEEVPYGTKNQKINSTPPNSAPPPPASNKKEVAPAGKKVGFQEEYCPVTQEELVKMFKKRGMNGKSSMLAESFFEEYSAKNWEISSSGARMRDVEAYVDRFVKKFKREEKDKQKHPAHQPVIDIFFTTYKKIHGLDFVGFDAREGKAVKELIGKIEEVVKMKNKGKGEPAAEVTPEVVAASFMELMKWILEDGKAKWYREQLSPRFINQNFNRIISAARSFLKASKGDDNVVNRMKQHQVEFAAIWEQAQQ